MDWKWLKFLEKKLSCLSQFAFMKLKNINMVCLQYWEGFTLNVC